jgi:hypothetical protein
MSERKKLIWSVLILFILNILLILLLTELPAIIRLPGAGSLPCRFV